VSGSVSLLSLLLGAADLAAWLGPSRRLGVHSIVNVFIIQALLVLLGEELTRLVVDVELIGRVAAGRRRLELLHLRTLDRVRRAR
jgi:hypothetical protein